MRSMWLLALLLFVWGVAATPEPEKTEEQSEDNAVNNGESLFLLLFCMVAFSKQNEKGVGVDCVASFPLLCAHFRFILPTSAEGACEVCVYVLENKASAQPYLCRGLQDPQFQKMVSPSVWMLSVSACVPVLWYRWLISVL